MTTAFAARKRTLGEDVLAPFKHDAAKHVATILDQQQLTQTEASYRIKDAPSQISLVVSGKTRGFSPGRLIRMLARLGCDIEITVRPARGRTGKVSHRFLAT